MLLPPPKTNNLWYDYNDSETVLVFIHGILSDSQSAWLHKGPPAVYWPELLKTDTRIGNVATYLAGYKTGFDSGPYEVANGAREVLDALKLPDAEGHPPVLSKKRIVFVCHSMGGIVTRYLLEAYREAFQGKAIGLVLIASPSFGSEYANWAEFAIKLTKNKQAKHLQWGNWTLTELDGRFRDLLNNPQRGYALLGVEAAEHYFVVPQLRVVWQKPIVPPESAGRYFTRLRTIPDTDHHTIARPTSLTHQTHTLLVAFLQEFAKLALPEPKPEEREAKKPEEPLDLDEHELLPFRVGREETLAEIQTVVTGALARQRFGVRIVVFQGDVSLDKVGNFLKRLAKDRASGIPRLGTPKREVWENFKSRILLHSGGFFNTGGEFRDWCFSAVHQSLLDSTTVRIPDEAREAGALLQLVRELPFTHYVVVHTLDVTKPLPPDSLPRYLSHWTQLPLVQNKQSQGVSFLILVSVEVRRGAPPEKTEPVRSALEALCAQAGYGGATVRERTGGQATYISTLGDVTQGEAERWRELYESAVDAAQEAGKLTPAAALGLKRRAQEEIDALYAAGADMLWMDEVEAVTVALYGELLRAQEGTK